MHRLVEDDHGGAKGGQRDVQTAAGRRGLQLLGEVPQVGVGGVAQEFEEVVVEAVGVGAVDDEVGDGEHLEQEAGPLALLGAVAQQALRVHHHHVADGVEGGPHAHRARLLRGGRFEHLPAREEGVVEGVGLALASVAKDGHHLKQLAGVAAQTLYEGRFVFYLGGREKRDITVNT